MCKCVTSSTKDVVVPFSNERDVCDFSGFAWAYSERGRSSQLLEVGWSSIQSGPAVRGRSPYGRHSRAEGATLIRHVYTYYINAAHSVLIIIGCLLKWSHPFSGCRTLRRRRIGTRRKYHILFNYRQISNQCQFTQWIFSTVEVAASNIYGCQHWSALWQ